MHRLLFDKWFFTHSSLRIKRKTSLKPLRAVLYPFYTSVKISFKHDKHRTRFDLLSSCRYHVLFSAATMSKHMTKHSCTNAQTQRGLPLSLYQPWNPCGGHQKKRKHLYATVTERTLGFAVDRLICGQGTRLDSAKKTNAWIQNKFRAREISRRAPRGARPERARTPSETHAPQMHPYTADVVKRLWKLVPSTQYFTCVLCYTAVGTMRPRKWKVG